MTTKNGLFVKEIIRKELDVLAKLYAKWLEEYDAPYPHFSEKKYMRKVLHQKKMRIETRNVINRIAQLNIIFLLRASQKILILLLLYQRLNIFKSLVKYKDVSNHEKKIKLQVELDKPTFFDLISTEHCPSSKMLYMMKNKFYSKNSNFNMVYQIASPRSSFLLKEK